MRTTLGSRLAECKASQPPSGLAFLITSATQPGMLRERKWYSIWRDTGNMSLDNQAWSLQRNSKNRSGVVLGSVTIPHASAQLRVPSTDYCGGLRLLRCRPGLESHTFGLKTTPTLREVDFRHRNLGVGATSAQKVRGGSHRLCRCPKPYPPHG